MIGDSGTNDRSGAGTGFDDATIDSEAIVGVP